MTTTLNYGRLDRPQERGKASTTQDAVAAVMASYAQWANVASSFRIAVEYNSEFNNDECEALYNEAEQLLRPIKDAIKTVVPSRLETVLSSLPVNGPMIAHGRSNAWEEPLPYSLEPSGIFASALINEAESSEFAIPYDRPILGYYLAEGKTILTKPGSTIFMLGFNSRGNIINIGRAQWMGLAMQGGTLVNFHTAQRLASYCAGGVVFNYGTTGTEPMDYGTGGVLVNAGKVSGNQAGFSNNGSTIINLASHFEFDTEPVHRNEYSLLDFSPEFRNSLTRHDKALLKRLRPIVDAAGKFSKARKTKKTIDAMKRFDWSEFGRRIKILVES